MLELSEFFKSLEVGKGVSSGLITLFPVFGLDIGEDFVLLDEALKTGKFRIKEVSSYGEVPQVLVENELDKRVLILEGEELKGAKQNRMVNVTIYLEKRSRKTIPVSCIEAGRWRFYKEEFETADHLAHPRLRRIKIESFLSKPPEKRDFHADQSAVWDEVERKLRSFNVSSSTQALSDAFEKKAVELKEIKKAFSLQEGQIGVIAGIGDQVVAFDFLASEKKFPMIFEKLINGYALDVLEVRKKGKVSSRKALNFLRKMVEAEDITLKKSVSVGQNFFFRAGNIIGQGLAVEGKVFHLSAFHSNSSNRGFRREIFRY